MNKIIKQMMWEAHRRIKLEEKNGDYIETQKPLNQKWIGLGTKTAYKILFDNDLMTWAASIPAKGCMGWVRFTDKGVDLYSELLPDLERIYADYEQSPASKEILAQFQLAYGYDKGD